MSVTNKSERKGRPGDCKSYSVPPFWGTAVAEPLTVVLHVCEQQGRLQGRESTCLLAGLSLSWLCFLSPQTKLYITIFLSQVGLLAAGGRRGEKSGLWEVEGIQWGPSKPRNNLEF